MSDIEIFQQEYPSLDSYWRAIILFGRNVASYKFALAMSLLELISQENTTIRLDDLSEPFSRYICQHLRTSAKQTTSQSSQFLEACQSFNSGELSKEKLLEVTVQKGFNNVIDAFHIVNSANIPIKFFEKNYKNNVKQIVLTDDFLKLAEIPFFDDLQNEVNARWSLVETAWTLGISRNLLNIQYDILGETLYVEDVLRRKSVTSARDALNGYQKGRCFFCFTDITVNGTEEILCDVDHFFPHLLQSTLQDININGIWNLVLACQKCNRGIEGKFARVPAVKYLQRLHKRNEFLISSHHPLRETLIKQTGLTEQKRTAFLREVDRRSINLLIHRWETLQASQEVF